MLKLKIQSLEGLSDAEKTHYKKVGEDYVLELDTAIKTEDDIRRLQSALEKERADHKDTKSRLTGYKNSPEEIDKLMSEVEELRIRAQKVDDKAISELVSIRVKPFEKEKESLSKQLQDAIKEKDSLRAELINRKLESEIRSVADGVVEPLSMADALLRGKSMLAYNEEKAGFYDKDGFGVKDWLEKTIPNTNWGIKGAGGGAKGRGFDAKTSITVGDLVFNAENNPFKEESLNLTHQSMIMKANPEMAKEFQKMAEKK